MSHAPCPHCGAERRYGVPENDPDAEPEPATCACGKEGPPNLPYEEVADRLHALSCSTITEQTIRTCRCGQPVVVGRREEDSVITHRLPHCRAFLDLKFHDFLEWLNTPAN